MSLDHASLWVLFVFMDRVCHAVLSDSLKPYGHLLGKGRPVFCFIVFLLLIHVVSCVRYGTRLYRFLIFAFFLTYMTYRVFNKAKVISIT